MNDRSPQIVADGAKRLRATKHYATTRARLLAELTQRHEAEMQGASFFRRLWIATKIRRTVSTELKRKFPPGSLHATVAQG